MDNDIIIKSIYAMTPHPEAFVDDFGRLDSEMMLELAHIQKSVKEAEKWLKEWKDSLLECMEQYGIRGYDAEDVKIIYKEPSERENFNKDKFCEKYQELYDEYIEFIPVKSSITIK